MNEISLTKKEFVKNTLVQFSSVGVVSGITLLVNLLSYSRSQNELLGIAVGLAAGALLLAVTVVVFCEARYEQGLY